jgi:hypothetical protein
MQELPLTELHWNGICGMCKVPNNVQLECWHLLMLDLGIINKQTLSSSTTTTTINNTHTPSPPRYRHFTTTTTPSSPSTTPTSVVEVRSGPLVTLPFCSYSLHVLVLTVLFYFFSFFLLLFRL